MDSVEARFAILLQPRVCMGFDRQGGLMQRRCNRRHATVSNRGLTKESVLVMAGSVPLKMERLLSM